MVPFERAFVTSYRPSIVTFPLSLRVSDIAAFVLQHATFSTPPLFPLSLPQISPCSPGSIVDGLCDTKSEGVGLIDRAINFQDFQPI